MTEEVIGMRELQLKLAKLGPAAGGKALRNSAASAMLPALRAAKSRAPVGTEPHKTYKGETVFPGHTSRSVRRRSVLSRDKTTAWAQVGVKSDAFYSLQFIERGWRAGPEGSQNRTRQAPRPWLEPAFDSTQQQILRRLKERLKKQIDKAAR